MILIAKSDGTLSAVTGDAVNQGSANVNEIYFLAPLVASAVVFAAFTLPNGVMLTPRLTLGTGGSALDVGQYGGGEYGYTLTPVPELNGMFTDGTGAYYNAWHISLDAPLAQYGGNLSVQLVGVIGMSVHAYPKAIIRINEGVPYIEPDISAADVSQMSSWLSAAATFAQSAQQDAFVAGQSQMAAAESASEAEAALDELNAQKDNIVADVIAALQNELLLKPATPEKPMLLALDANGNTFLREYSNQATGNSIVQRTGGGGAKFVTQYNSPDNVATMLALETAQACAYMDSFSATATEIKYKPYAFAAKAWKSWTGEGTITEIPTSGNWYQKLCNGSSEWCTATFRDGALVSSNTNRNTIYKLIAIYTDKARIPEDAKNPISPGRYDFSIEIAPHSVVQIYTRNQTPSSSYPEGYTQIWIM